MIKLSLVLITFFVCLVQDLFGTLRVRGEVTATKVQVAIDCGVQYLRSTQLAAGNWPEHSASSCGLTSLCTLALLNSGVPSDDPVIQSAMAYLRRIEPQDTYAVSLQTLVYCQLGSAGDVTRIRRNVQWLVDRQKVSGKGAGGWGYFKSEGSTDPSNSQFAILALGAAEERGVELNREVFERAQQYWLASQKQDGGWSYFHSSSIGSMTCAGIASLVICRGRVNAGDASIRDNTIHCCGDRPSADDPVEKGLQWLGKRFSVTVHPGARGSRTLYYYLYALERVGRMTGRRLIGGHDWYREGADFLIQQHERFLGTYWKGTQFHAENDPNIATSFALLFLAKGKRQVVVGRLRYGTRTDRQEEETDWGRHHDGLRQLVRRVERHWGRDLTWQTVDLAGSKVQDLLHAPVLVISGSQRLAFTETEKKRLKQYLDQGGNILFEANAGKGCGSAADFESSVQQLCQAWFPGSGLTKLPPEHPVWIAEGRVDPTKMGTEYWLYGVQACCRTAVFYSPQSLTCRWELSDPNQRMVAKHVHARVRSEINAAAQLGQNILAYATGRKLLDKLATRSILKKASPHAAADRGVIMIPALATTAAPDEARRALPNLIAMLTQRTPMRVDAVPETVAIDADALEMYPIAWLHGRSEFTLTASQRSSLRTYLENGGVLLANAICGNPAFTNAFRKELAVILPDGPLRLVPPDHPMLGSRYGGYKLQEITLREPTNGPAGLTIQRRRTPPVIEVAMLDNVVVAILSPYDLSCALESPNSIQCPGYSTLDATKIATNMILYSLQQ